MMEKGNKMMALTDMIIVVEGTKIHVHRVVLTARSKHFGAVFNSGMKESDADELEMMDGISLEIFLPFLSWIYTSIPFSSETTTIKSWMGLLLIADQLNEIDLVHCCENGITKLLNVRYSLSTNSLK